MKKQLDVLLVLLLAALPGFPQQAGQMMIVNGASFDADQPLAPGSFASIFGDGLCSQRAVGNWTGPGQLPTTLGGCSITVGATAAMLYYVSPSQINFVVPAGVASGQASVVVHNGSLTLTGSVMIGPAGPGIFALNGMGMGEGALLHGTKWQLGPFSITTEGQPTPLSIYVTGLDLTTKPAVTIGGASVDVTWWGNAPGFVGLQQINITLPANMAGVGRVPMTVTSDGLTSNMVFLHLLPTTAMMKGVPGWSSGDDMGENRSRGHEMSNLAVNAANNTALVTDENDDVVRVISLASRTTTATITLPEGSQAHGIAVNAAGTLAAVTLSAKASVALIDLTQNIVLSVIGTGYYPSRAAFSGNTLLVTNGGSGTVSVIDTTLRAVTQTVTVGFGPSGIAANGTVAVVANMQGASLSLINLAGYGVTTVTLPAGSRPHEVALSTTLNKAVISLPMAGEILVLDLATKAVATVDTGTLSAMGPGAIAVNGSTAYVANQMSAGVTVVDLAAAKVVETFPVDPGPRALAVNAATNQLLVLAEGTGTLDIVDLSTYTVTARLNAGDTEREGNWALPTITSVTPNTAAAGATVDIVIAGTNLQSVSSLEFHITGSPYGMGGGGMGGEDHGNGLGHVDQNIVVSDVKASADGTSVTATVQILPAAEAGTRQIRMKTDRGEVMSMMTGVVFTVTK